MHMLAGGGCMKEGERLVMNDVLEDFQALSVFRNNTTASH